MIDFTPIIEAIIGLLAAIITVKVIPWIKAKTTNEQQIMIGAAVKTLVFAAEQIYGAGKGEEKLAYVITQMEKQGYTADRNIIEAAVRENILTLHTVKVEE
jgi:uncharacterized protein YbcI